jgi:CRISPR-associated protein Csd1
MILQRLANYYDRISTDPATADALPKPGYSVQQISFCVVLRPDGSLQGFHAISDGNERNPRALRMLVPGQSKPTGQGINPCFLWDNAAYMLTYKADDANPSRTREAFEAFRQKHLELENALNDPTFTAVCTFLKDWSPERAAERAADLEKITGNFGVFKIAGEMKYVHDDPEVVAYWAGHEGAADAEGTVAEGFCLVTGLKEPIARLHEPKIKGVAGGQSSGGLLVSFNDDAYESFGKEQGAVAPVSATAAFKYANALNYLLSCRDRRSSLGDATVTYWAEKPKTSIENVFDQFFDGYAITEKSSPEDVQRANEVKAFVRQLREGHADGDPFDADNTVGFYILGLSPNASRISVRFWVQSTVGQMKAKLRQHLDDVELVGAREGDPPLAIRRIVEATGRAKLSGGKFTGYDADAVPPLLAGALARAVFEGLPYPQMLLGAMLNRLRADGHVSHARVAAIKALLVRSDRSRYSTKEALVALDPSRTDAPYVTGRLFALLERIQSDSAGGDLNATIKDRYFSAASATPGIVFPRLIRLSQHHLSKLSGDKPGLKVNHDKLCGEIIGKLNGFAGHFNLEDQGLFAVGYYHQRQDFYTSKKTKEEGAPE